MEQFLTKKLDNGYIAYNCDEKSMQRCGAYNNCSECPIPAAVKIKLHKLEQQLKNGLLIELPCPEGTLVYEIYESYDNYLDDRFAYDIEKVPFEAHMRKQWGVTVFSSEPEAIAKVQSLLKKQKQENLIWIY